MNFIVILASILRILAAVSGQDSSLDSEFMFIEDLAKCLSFINGNPAMLQEAILILDNRLTRAWGVQRDYSPAYPNRPRGNEVADGILNMMTNGEYGWHSKIVADNGPPRKKIKSDDSDEESCEISHCNKRRTVSPSTRKNILAMIDRGASVKDHLINPIDVIT